MNKTFFASILILSIFVGAPLAVSAQENSSDEIAPSGIKATSPFHFLDRLGDWARLNVFTLNPVRKAEVRVQIAEERLAELQDVVESSVADEQTVEKLEARVEKRISEARRKAEELDTQNRDASKVVERLSDFDAKRQRVLERVLERVSEQAREKVASALDNVYKQAEEHQALLLKQKEKGFVSEEKAQKLIENRFENFKNQLERQKERVLHVEDESTRVRLEEALGNKIELLESELINVESKEGLREVRERLSDVKKDTIDSVLHARAAFKLRSTTTEDVLEKLRDDSVDFKSKTEEMIRKTKTEIQEVVKLLERAKTENVEIAGNVEELLQNAQKHLTNATNAFANQSWGEAFGQATAGYRNAHNALEALKKRLGVRSELPQIVEKYSRSLKSLETRIQALGEKAPQELRDLLRQANEHLEKVRALINQQQGEEARHQLEVVRRIIEKLEQYLARLKGVQADNLEKRLLEEKELNAKRLQEETEQAKERLIKRLESRKPSNSNIQDQTFVKPLLQTQPVSEQTKESIEQKSGESPVEVKPGIQY